MGNHEWRTWMFFGCELLNVAVAAFNFWLTNKFLEGKFTWYGYDSLNYLMMNETEQSKTYNPMCYTFPTIVSSSL